MKPAIIAAFWLGTSLKNLSKVSFNVAPASCLLLKSIILIISDITRGINISITTSRATVMGDIIVENL